MKQLFCEWYCDHVLGFSIDIFINFTFHFRFIGLLIWRVWLFCTKLEGLFLKGSRPTHHWNYHYNQQQIQHLLCTNPRVTFYAFVTSNLNTS